MVNMSNTKAQLFAAYNEACADAHILRHTIKALRDDLCMAQQPTLLPQGKSSHTAYYDYVRTQRLAQRKQPVCTYKTFAQWSAA